MARVRSPNRDKAYEIYKEYNGNIANREIANILDISEKTISGWKAKDKWSEKLNGVLQQEIQSTPKEKRTKGGQPKNKNAEKFGFFSKHLPKETLDLMKEISEKTQLDILWDQITIQYAAIIRAQQIMYVENKDEMIKELKKHETNEFGEKIEYEFQFAWDRQATFLNAQSRAMGELRGSIKQYESMINSTFNLVTEEQRLRIEKLKADVQKLEKENEVIVDDKPFVLPWNVISPAFIEALHEFEDKVLDEYVFTGGRGSTKSSFISLKIIEIIKNNPTMNAVIVRQVANTLRDSVFAQMQWAIGVLNLEEEFKCTTSPLEMTYKPTGQKIYFRGADEPTKLKGIKVATGYIGILWLEELDQFKGQEAVRTIEQSVIRGGDKAYKFKSFNPPKTANNWANKYIKIPKKKMYLNHSNYTQVPKKWLGKAFIDDAEHLKEVNPKAYEHEYLGIVNGNGGNVFDNVVIRKITNDEINTFDRVYMGVDWGWFPDPWVWNKMYYNSAQRKLYIFDEARANKKSNKDTYEILINEKGVTPANEITCDSAEKKSIGDYKDYGLFARGAIKGPGSVDYSMKWLASLSEIVVDNIRCPNTATEFLDYEYERTKDGEVISGYPDKDNHHIDAVRYATEKIWRVRGQ